MYRFLLTPRWLALHIVVLLVIPAFVFLGRWQFGRYEERSTSSHRITANLSAAPVPVEELTTPGGGVRVQDGYRTVTATGTFDTAHQLLVRRRTQNSAVGFYVLTPLETGNGQAVLVNRGWVKAGATADALPEVPAPSPGQVTVTGRLRPSETEESSGIRDRQGLPPGQVLLISTETIGRGLPYRLLGGYVELTGQSPKTAEAPAPVLEPDVGGGGGLNLAYGVQWWLFIGIAVGGWAMLIRREAADLRAQAAERAKKPAGSGGPKGSEGPEESGEPERPESPGPDESGEPGKSGRFQKAGKAEKPGKPEKPGETGHDAPEPAGA